MKKKLVVSMLKTLGGFVVKRLESRDRFDEKPIGKLEPNITSCKLPKNQFKATPEIINALKEENGNDDIMFKLTLISLIENA